MKIVKLTVLGVLLLAAFFVVMGIADVHSGWYH